MKGKSRFKQKRLYRSDVIPAPDFGDIYMKRGEEVWKLVGTVYSLKIGDEK